MAFELHRVPGLPGIAASAMSVNAAVTPDTGDTQRQYVPIATVNLEPIGLAAASVIAAGDAFTIYDGGHIVRAVAIASLGAGADIGVASTNGALGLIAAASGVVKYRVGKSQTAAAAAETFALLVNPKQISGSP